MDGDKLSRSNTRGSAKGRPEQSSHPGSVLMDGFVLVVPPNLLSVGQLSVFCEGFPIGSLDMASEYRGSLWGIDLRKG